MPSLTNARVKAMIDTELVAHTHIGYSVDGVTEYSTAILARTPISALGGWTAPVAAAPYGPTNAAAGDSAAAGAITGSTTIGYYATFNALAAGTQLTDWIPTTDPDPILITGGKLSHAIGAIKPINTTKP